MVANTLLLHYAWTQVSLILAVTFGSGVQWHEAYTFVHQHGRSIVGGISLGGSVGSAGGWIMGGGHSALSPSLGLGNYCVWFPVISLINTPNFRR